MAVAISSIIGLLLYFFLFLFIIQRNFNSTRLEQRNEKFIKVLYSSIYDENNPPFFPALWICIFSIATDIMYISFSKGLIFNIIQQACYVSWEICLFVHILYVLDPFNRVVKQDYLKRIAQIIYILLIFICFIEIVLFIISLKTPSGSTTSSKIYFIGVAFFLMCVSVIVANFLIKIYLSCLRGLQTSQKEIPESYLAGVLSRRKVLATKFDLTQLNPSIDMGCSQSLSLQALMIERLLGFCALTFIINFYKLIWSASLAGCYFRTNCSTVFRHNEASRIANDLSYWVPDFILYAYWVIFLLHPLNIHLTSSARKTPSLSSTPASLIQREITDLRASVVVMNDNPLIEEGRIPHKSRLSLSNNNGNGNNNINNNDKNSNDKNNNDKDSNNNINNNNNNDNTNSNNDIENNTSNIDHTNSSDNDDDSDDKSLDINPNVPMDQFDQKRLSRPSQTSLPTSWLSQINHENEPESNQAFDYSTLKEYRELHITLSEMVLIDKRIGIPVPSLFAGRDTFVVMSVRGLEYLDQAASIKRKSKQVSITGEFSPFNEKNLNNPQDDWVEISRSDCRINEVSPNFIVSFIIPTVESLRISSRIKWRFDIYNAAKVDASFRVDTAVLSEQKLIGVVYVSNTEFDGYTTRQSRSSLWQHTHPDSDDEEDDPRLNNRNSNSNSNQQSNRYSVVTKHISVMEFGNNFVRLGGRLRISSCVVRPYSFVITEISGINMMLHKRKRKSENNSSDSSVRSSINRPQGTLSKDSVLRSFVITKTELNEKKNKLKSREIRVGEELIESPYSFCVPIAFLRFLLTDRVDEFQIFKRRFNIQDVDVNYIGDDWRCGVASLIKRDIESIRKLIDEYENTPLTFKSSSKKSDSSLRYIPVNLHLHVFKMSGDAASVSSLTKQQQQQSNNNIANNNNNNNNNNNEHHQTTSINYTCDFMTVGAFAAHSMKFKAGGLWHMMNLFDERLSKQTKGLVPTLKNDFRLPDEIWNRISITQLPADSKIFYMAYLARQRFDICLSQCLAALVTGFVSRIRLMSPAAMERMAIIGLLFEFESLLSTQGSEMGMLADMYCTIKSLSRVQLKVHEEVPTRQSEARKNSTVKGPEASIEIYWCDVDEANDQYLIVDMGFNPEWFKELPKIIQDGKTIQVIPIFFSVGINELQSYAEAVAGKKASELQDIINLENLERMEKYCSLVIGLENGEYDLHSSDSDCTSTEYNPVRGSSDSKFPFSVSSRESKSYLSITPKSHEARIHSSSTDHEHDDGSKSISRRKTAILSTEAASSLLNTKKSRLHSIVVPNSFEHQILTNSSTNNESTAPRRMVPRQTSLAKIWDTVDSDEEIDVDEEESNNNTSKFDNLPELELDDPFRRSIALCQEVSIDPIPTLPVSAFRSTINPLDTFNKNQHNQHNQQNGSNNNQNDNNNGHNNSNNSNGNSNDNNNNQNKKINNDENMHDSDNEDEEDEIRALRIEEALNSKFNTRQERQNRKRSFVQYVEGVLTKKTSNSNRNDNNKQGDLSMREKSLSVFSSESDYPTTLQLPEESINSGKNNNNNNNNNNANSKDDNNSNNDNNNNRSSTGRITSTASNLSNWIKTRGNSHEKKQKKFDDPDLEMGEFGKNSEFLPKDSLSYLSDCMCLREDNQQTLGSSIQRLEPKSYQKKIEKLLKILKTFVQNSIGNGGKPYQILTTAAKLTRLLDGVRSTSCKSAKDRTGMSVTLEEVMLVRDVFGINDIVSQNLLDTLRIHGVRLENAKKNIGQPRFAFNRVQRRFLPPVYAPPISVIGSVSS